MPGFGGFYKGEKKKAKKGQEGKSAPVGSAPQFVMPELIKKKKENNW